MLERREPNRRLIVERLISGVREFRNEKDEQRAVAGLERAMKAVAELEEMDRRVSEDAMLQRIQA